MEEAPAEFEKTIKECVHLRRGDHFGKQGEVPLGGENFDRHANLLQVLVQLR